MSKQFIKKVMGIIIPILTAIIGYYAITSIPTQGKGYYLLIGILVISSWYVSYLLLKSCKECKWLITVYTSWIITPICIVRANQNELIILLPFTAIEINLDNRINNRFNYKFDLW
jgi:hypothetical protein